MGQVILLFTFGVLLGAALMKMCISVLTVDATFVIESTPEKDIYRLDITRLDNITKKKWMLLRIQNNADDSHQ